MRSLRGWLMLTGLAAATTLGATASKAAVQQPDARRPNLVFILCDDLGYGDLACFGSKIIRTPNLDRLAARGLKLTSCYASSPVCSPSRAGIMTGRNPNRLGIRDWIPPDTGIYLRESEVTVAEVLRSVGYRTALVGKWHLNSKMDGSEPGPREHGFDHWFATQNNAQPNHQNPVNFWRNGKPVGPLRGNSTTLTAEEGMRFIRENRDRPFALFVWFHAPHEPVSTPEEYTRRYPGYEDPTKPIYYGSVTLVDHEVGRIVRSLEENGVADRTCVMFTSDNGPETLHRYRTAVNSHGSPGPWRGMKLHVTEAGYRVPGILYWPGKTHAGQVSDEPVSGLDLLPTVCEMVGVPVPNGRALDGASFMPVFNGQPVRRRTPLYWQYNRAISKPWTFALREGEWKLLADAKQERFALYNLREDGAETRDLSTREPERVKSMAAALRRQHQEIEAEAARLPSR